MAHGPLCERCSVERCLECASVGGRKIRAHDGVCYDCTDLPAATDCDEAGARACEKGWYLATNEDGKRTCEKCAAGLDHCLECSDKDTCTKCSSSFFQVNEEGKCDCKGGKNAFYDAEAGADGGCACP